MLAELREKMKGWKTVIWNVLIALSAPFAIALQKLDAIDWSQWVGPVGAIGIGFVIAAVGIGLRCATTGPVGAKGDEQPAPDVKAGD